MNRTGFSTLLGIAAAVLLSSLPPAKALAGSHQAATAGEAAVVACRVLEAHASERPAVTAVIFHQRDKQDGARLGELLTKNSGASVELQIGAGAWQPATVARLKSCFGRGLLLVPREAQAPKDGEAFLLKFPARAE